MATIKDVAELAGVSITTVSHVINKTRYVSDDLTERVSEAMRELNYQPNILAGSLRSGRSKTIGLIVPDISNMFFAEVARRIEDRGLDHGYSVILCNTDDDDEKEAGYINVLISKRVDGIIFISAGFIDENIQKPLIANIPFVIADREISGVQADVVLVDNFRGGYEATKYLIDLGHTDIACITGPSRLTPSSLRVEGYYKAMREAGLYLRDNFEIIGDFRAQGGEAAMEKLLSSEKPPTAVFACNDMMALGALRSIYNHDLKVPGDISIIGFDDIPLSRCIYPAMTTIAQPMKELAKLVVDFLVERMQINVDRRNKKIIEFRKKVLDVTLVERGSCQAKGALNDE